MSYESHYISSRAYYVACRYINTHVYAALRQELRYHFIYLSCDDGDITGKYCFLLVLTKYGAFLEICYSMASPRYKANLVSVTTRV
jgi:hypothetical protein